MGAVFVLAVTVAFGALEWRERNRAEAFDFVRWELASLPNKWLHALGAPLRDDPPPADALARWLALDDRDSEEARRLEGTVEAAIEGRIDAVLDELGIGLPSGPLPVLPPVDIELAGAPRVLVVSPRARIERLRADVLRPDLPLETQLDLERAAEDADLGVSALVVPSGGVATYPAVVSDLTSYRGIVETGAHEWVHHYLTFYPLGRSYFASNDARAINETVADIAGSEVAAMVLERWGDPTPPPTPRETDGTATAAPEAGRQIEPAERDAVLRDLRLEVDALLAEGRIEEAELRMEVVRTELEAGGVFIRRINQAYFAWYGTYTARPDSVDPLGPQLRELRERAGSLPRFLELVRGATTRDDITRLIADGAPAS